MLQDLLGEAGADPAGEQEAVRALVADKQSAEISAAAFGWRVAADHKLLLLGQFNFDPGATAPAGLVERIRFFADQTLELELPRQLEQLLSGAPQLLREADIGWSVL